MQRSLARKLIALFVLLALIAGGDRFGTMALAMDAAGTQMSDMQKPDMSCKACGGSMAVAPCDAVCAVLPAIDDVAIVGLPEVGRHQRWMTRFDSCATHAIRPDTSPPRA